MSEVPVLPAMFACSALKLRLTVAGCVRLFRAAQEKRPQAWDSHGPCRTCAIGAGNAGVTGWRAAILGDAVTGVCSRCLKVSGRIINARLCVGCYNRHQEAIKGRNAKGTRPALSDALHPEAIVVLTAEREMVVREPKALTAAELAMQAARSSSGRLVIGWGRQHAA